MRGVTDEQIVGRRQGGGRVGGLEDPGTRDHTLDVGLAEDQVGPLRRIVCVDRHVGGARRQDPEDRHVQVAAAGGHPHADPVSSTHPAAVQPRSSATYVREELRIAQSAARVFEGGRLRVPRCRLTQDVDERPRRGGRGRQIEILLHRRRQDDSSAMSCALV